MYQEMEKIFEEVHPVDNNPWQDARAIIPIHLANGGHKVKRIAQYARHLEDENANLKYKYDLANSTISTATNRLNEVKSENESLKKRVEELTIELSKRNPEKLCPARLMATAAAWLKNKSGYHFSTTVSETYSGIAEPYKLRDVENDRF